MKTAPTTLRARLALTLANLAEKIALPGILKRAPRTLSGVDDSRGWFSLFSSGRHLGFQTDTQVESHDSLLAQTTIFACITQIAADIGKLRAKLMELTEGIWTEVSSPAFSPVLRKPNHFQTWQRFIEQWVISLLTRGNAYVLKVRDARRVVVALYVLDPVMVRPLVAGNGEVFYSVQQDDLSRVFEAFDGPTALPASEIIHGRINCLFHPLVGISPLFAAGLSASKALKADSNAARFFANQSQPGGVLSGPGEISDPTAERLKKYFEENFSGNNAGKLAVLGDNLKFESLRQNAVDSQMVEQLEMSAKQVAASFKVPGYLVGAADVPPNNNVEALRLDYYGRCLQSYIEGIENDLDDGLALGKMTDGRTLGIELDLDGLLRMDTAALTAALTEQVRAGIISPNEARRRLNLPPVIGGESPMAQQQQFSLAALAERDANSPFAKPDPAAPAVAASSAAKRLRVRASTPILDGQMWRVSKAIGGEIKTHHFAEESAAKAWAAEDETEGLVIDGLSFSDVKAMVDQTVEKAMAAAAAALPAPKDGAAGASAFELAQARGFDGSLDRWLESLKGERGERGEKGDAGPVGLQGPEGLSGRDGRDGQQGEAGRDAFQIEVLNSLDDRMRYSRGTVAAHRGGLVRALMQTAPLKSVDGDLARAGWQVLCNGVFKDEQTTDDEGRTMRRTVEFTDGSKSQSTHRMQSLIYRGAWKSGQAGAKEGDAFTYGGCVWVCKRDTATPPPGAAWQLAVKSGDRGRAGKDSPIVVNDGGEVLGVLDGQP
jgi:HK97 family phage portal protein